MKKAISVSARDFYHIENPFKTIRPMHDKYGVLHFVSMEQYLKEAKEPKNIWNPTFFEMLLPNFLLAVGIVLIFFTIFSFLKAL